MNSISQKEYVENSGVCPRCGSDNISADGVEIDLGIAKQDCWCDKCYMSWTDEYELVGIRSVYDANTNEEWEVTT